MASVSVVGRVVVALAFVLIGLPTAAAQGAAVTPGAWTPTGAPLAQLSFNGAVLLPTGKALAVDVNGRGELFDPHSGTWSLTGQTHGGVGPMVVLGNGHVLMLATGSTGSQEFDPATGAWVARGSMHAVHDEGTLTLLPSGKVLVAGGTDESQTGCCPNACCSIATAELYDPATGTFSLAANMPTARTEQFAILLPSGKVLVGGGFTATGTLAAGGGLVSADPVADLYDAVFGTWSTTGSLPLPAFSPGVALLGDGRVLVAGGQPTPGARGDSPTVATQLYTPTTGTWQRSADLTDGAEGNAFVLADGSADLLGPAFQIFAEQLLVNAERFDPANGTWTPGETGRVIGFTANTLLPDGKILGTEPVVPAAGVFVPPALPPLATSCAVSLVGTDPQGHSFLRVAARDVAAGLQSIKVLSATNARVALPSFARFARDPEVTAATKIDQTQRASLTLQVTNAAGAQTKCDPTVSHIERQQGEPAVEIFRDVAPGESQVLVVNGQPGVQSVEVRVDGRAFELEGLQPSEQRTLNVASAMRFSAHNWIAVRGRGERGASADLVISD